MGAPTSSSSFGAVPFEEKFSTLPTPNRSEGGEGSECRVKFLHGTTTLAFKYRNGVVVATDSRASAGGYIGISSNICLYLASLLSLRTLSLRTHSLLDGEEDHRDRRASRGHNGRRRRRLPVLGAQSGALLPPVRSAQPGAHLRGRGEQIPLEHAVPVPRHGPLGGHHDFGLRQDRPGPLLRR